VLLLTDSEKDLKMYCRQNPLHLSYIDFFQSLKLNVKWEEMLSIGSRI